MKTGVYNRKNIFCTQFVLIILSCYYVCVPIIHSTAGEILFPPPENLLSAIRNYSHPADERNARYLILMPENLDSLSAKPLSLYTSLEAVILQFAENPESSDTSKESMILSVERKLPMLSHLRKCPQLKYLVIQTGEYLFIRSTDRIPYSGAHPSIRQKADILNLERLDKRFGKMLSELLPGIKVYAYNGSW